MTSHSRHSRSALWLGIYGLCVVFVFSFILFEVLDVDGSDFPAPPNRLAVKWADPPHDEVRRALVHGSPDSGITTPGVTGDHDARASAGLDRIAAARSWPPAPSRAHRIVLPRASLADAAPSA